MESPGDQNFNPRPWDSGILGISEIWGLSKSLIRGPTGLFSILIELLLPFLETNTFVKTINAWEAGWRPLLCLIRLHMFVVWLQRRAVHSDVALNCADLLLLFAVWVLCFILPVRSRQRCLSAATKVCEDESDVFSNTPSFPLKGSQLPVTRLLKLQH